MWIEYCDNELINALCDTLNSDKLLRWAMQQDSFWETFDNEITEAREMLSKTAKIGKDDT